MKIYNFGILLAHIRLEHHEILKDMAESPCMSPAYLSFIETGRHPIKHDSYAPACIKYLTSNTKTGEYKTGQFKQVHDLV